MRALEGAEALISARVAGQRNISFRQELSPAPRQELAAVVRVAGARESDAWKKFDGLLLEEEGVSSTAAPDFCWAFTWEMVHGRMDVKARWLATGYQAPELSMAWSRRLVARICAPPHLRVTPCSALEKLRFCCVDFRDGFLEAGNFEREVYLRAPMG